MAAKLRYRMSLKAIQTTDLEGITKQALDAEIGRALSGGDNAGVWAGNAIADWAAGVMTYKESGNGTINTTNGDNGVWIKHSGFDYDSGDIDLTSPNTDTLIITADGSIIARLEAGQSIFLPHPETVAFVLTDDGDPIAVEYAVFT